MRGRVILAAATITALVILNVGCWYGYVNQAKHDTVSIPLHDPKYHGADLLKIGWKDEITAYKWDGKRYVEMWRRK